MLTVGYAFSRTIFNRVLRYWGRRHAYHLQIVLTRWDRIIEGADYDADVE